MRLSLRFSRQRLFVSDRLHLKRRRRWQAVTAGLLICGLVGGHLWLYLPYTADDAFISFRYARHFALGHGLVFNIDERVEGFSTFTWVLLLGLLNRAGLDIPTTAKLLNCALALGIVLVLALFAPHRPFAGIWAALLLAADAAFAYWGANGMEPPLTTLLLLLGGMLHLRELEQLGRPPLSALCFGILALTRPEGAFFFGLTALHRLMVSAFQADPCDHPPARPAARYLAGVSAFIQRDWRWMALFAAIFVPFLLWRYSYYGQWLPNTVAVKSGIHIRSLLEGVLSVYSFVAARAAALAVLVLGFARTPGWWRQRPAGYAALLLSGNALFVTLAGGDWMPLDRFWVLVLPWLYVLVVSATHTLLRSRQALAALLAGLLLLALAGSVVTRLTSSAPAINNAGPGPARWLQHVARPGDVVASSNIGAIGYYHMDLVILDLVGLTDAHIAHTPARFPGGLLARGNGYGHWDSAYVLGRKPRFIEIAGISREAGTTWTGHAAWAGADDLYQHPEFRRMYQYADLSYFIRVDQP